MAALSIQVPYPVFYDRDGQPLDNGSVYIGVANLDPVTNPIQVYYDSALTIPASQPLKTSNGYVYRNGTPAQLYVDASSFSILINDSKNTLVYSFADGTGLGVGAASVEYDPPFLGALTSGYTVEDKLAQYVSVKDFGAVGDGVTDDTNAIQAAINYATYTGKCSCYIPGGRYRITKTIQLGYGVTPTGGSSPYSSPHVFGDGPSYRGEAWAAGTTIIADFGNAPAFNFQGVRSASLSNIAIIGVNLAYALASRLGNWGLTVSERPTVDDLVLANWVGPNIAASGTTRYAPYAAITTDAYSGSRPATSYPDVTYPSIFGAPAQWNKLGTSSGIRFSNVYIGGFYAGLVTYPSGGDGQGEFYEFNNCLFEYNAYGIVITHTQARNFVLNASRIDNHYYALATGVFGIQNGSAVYEAYGCTFDRNINVFQLSAGNTGPAVLNGCYGESLYRLGNYSFTGSTIQKPMVISGCEFSFAGQNSRGNPENIMGGRNGSVSISNCNFSSFLGTPLFALNVSDFSDNSFNLIDIYGGWCYVRTGTADQIPALYSYFPLRAMGVALRNSGNSPFIGGAQTIPAYTASTGVPTGGSLSVAGAGETGYFGRGSVSLYSSTTRTTYQAAEPGILNGFNGFAQNIVGRTTFTISMSGLTATITVPALASDDVYNVKGMNPGDMIVFWDGNSANNIRVFFIRARTGNVITAELQNGFTVTVNGSGYPTVPVYSGTIDNNSDLYFHCCRFYMPTILQNATLTAASNTLTNVQAPEGTTFTTDFAVDDTFYASRHADNWIDPESARITNVNAGLKTITLTSNALISETRRVPVLIKKAPANS